MKRAGLVGLLAVVIAVAFWTAPDDDDDHPRSKVTYRDGRPAPAPRRTPVREVDSIAASADGPLRIEGRVIDPEGEGVAGAIVALEPGGGTATSAADGRFRFTRLERRTYTLFASTSDLLAGPIRAAATESPSPVMVRLAPGGSHTIAVVEGNGQPIVGAQVHGRGSGWSSNRSADIAGKATLGPVPPGRIFVTVEAPGHAPDMRALLIALAEQPGETTIVLHRGVSVSGRVIDEGHAPIAEAHIAVIAPGGGDIFGGVAPIVTDERGEFTVPALVRDTYALQASDDEHARARSMPFVVADAPIDGIEITMEDGGVITGVVLDGGRKPAPLATLIALEAGGARREVITDANGGFELRGMARSFSSLRAETATATSRALHVNLSDKAKADVELVVDSIGTIAGTVVDERGAPLAGITVTAYPDWGRMPSGVGAPVTLLDAISDADGAFVLHGPPDIPYRLDARRRTTAYARPSQLSTPAAIGDHHVRIRLVPDGRITGRIVVDGVDAPPTDVLIQLWGGPPALASRDGSFQIAELPPGTYWLSFEGPELLPFQRSAEVRSAQTTDLGTLTAARGRTLRGRIVDSSGAPFGGARVEVGVIRPPPVEIDDPAAGFHAYRTGFSAADGSFRVNHVPPAPMFVVASTQTAGCSEPVAVPGGLDTPGDPPPVTLVLSPSREVR